MHNNRWIHLLIATLTLAVGACDDGGSDPEPSETGATGSAQTETGATGGTETETGATGSAGSETDGAECDEPNPAGCSPGDCANGEVCTVVPDQCLSSGCSCNSDLGTWDCTPDCGGGVCVPDDEVLECEGEDPSGCVVTGCDEGEICLTGDPGDPGDLPCTSSGCDCDVLTGTWVCSPDCGGGVCVPEDEAAACEGDNPAEQCSDDPADCVPSGCSCNSDLGTWDCTPDCNPPEPC